MVKTWIQDIPAEIRLKVYKHYFETAIILMHNPATDEHYSLCNRRRPQKNLLNLLLTCKTIKEEAYQTCLKVASYVPTNCCILAEDDTMAYFENISEQLLSQASKAADIENLNRRRSREVYTGSNRSTAIFTKDFQRCKLTNWFRSDTARDADFARELIILGGHHKMQLQFTCRLISAPVLGGHGHLSAPGDSTCITNEEDYRVFSRPNRVIKIMGKTAEGCNKVKDWLVDTKQELVGWDKQSLPCGYRFEILVKGESAG
ncbi:hypothetical protein PMZ80_010413 [Knufia obscura]|uniref:Uncharacterized protein n=1 Tax=Knufia obscura TaxID=1635080 RepID=A0ABR0R9T7_9EURO|nr:hypothetical protein PMZ80_010413 [Knufia obscura]